MLLNIVHGESGSFCSGHIVERASAEEISRLSLFSPGPLARMTLDRPVIPSGSLHIATWYPEDRSDATLAASTATGTPNLDAILVVWS